jgi:hypothetical protein
MSLEVILGKKIEEFLKIASEAKTDNDKQVFIEKIHKELYNDIDTKYPRICQLFDIMEESSPNDSGHLVAELKKEDSTVINIILELLKLSKYISVFESSDESLKLQTAWEDIIIKTFR